MSLYCVAFVSLSVVELFEQRVVFRGGRQFPAHIVDDFLKHFLRQRCWVRGGVRGIIGRGGDVPWFIVRHG